jgi:hypothetical protein
MPLDNASPQGNPEEPPMSDTRQLAHDLIDRLPETQLSGLVRFLETIVDPVAGALANAPPEDEEISQDEERAVGEARESLKRNGGRGVPHSEAMRRLGLD